MKVFSLILSPNPFLCLTTCRDSGSDPSFCFGTLLYFSYCRGIPVNSFLFYLRGNLLSTFIMWAIVYTSEKFGGNSSVLA
jgi:hypothetical protein